MCRNIRTLYNYEPPATEEEIQAAALQYVRKISGFTSRRRRTPRRSSEAVDAVTRVSEGCSTGW